MFVAFDSVAGIVTIIVMTGAMADVTGIVLDTTEPRLLHDQNLAEVQKIWTS